MLGGLVVRVRELLRGARLDRETDEELRFHLERLAEDERRRGLDPEQALRRARLALGNPLEVRERLAERRTGAGLDTLVRDATHALRALRRRPAFAAAFLLTVALGVGASTALFAVVHGVVLAPLPLPEAERLVRIYDTNPAKGVARTGVTTGNLADWRRRARGFDGIVGAYTMGRTLTLGAESEVVISAQVTEGFFELVGVRPALGRSFAVEETRAALFNTAAAPIAADPVVVLSHRLWQRRFGGDPSVLGRTVLVERRPMRVVGVAAAGFGLPSADVDLFLPWGLPENPPRDQHYLTGLARVARGTSLDEAAAELRRVAATLAVEHPRTNEGWSVALVPLHEDLVGGVRAPLLFLLLAAALVLVVGSANVALLSLARGLEQLPEASLRQALGASRARLVRQFLMEPLLVSAAGGALGVLLAASALRLLKQAGTGLSRLNEVGLGPEPLAVAAAATALSALVAGLPAALRLSRADPAPGIVRAAGRVAGAAGRHRLRDGLVVLEVASAVALLAGAALLVRSYERLRAVDPGYEPRGVLIAPVFLDMEHYGSGDRSSAYYQTLLERLRALPGVVAAGAATALPASPLGPDFERPVWPEEQPQDERARRPAWVRMVTTDYFRTLGIRLVAGRPFGAEDGPRAPRRALLSEGLALRLFPGASAVGRRVVIDYSMAGTYPYEIVGVVGDVRFSGPRTEPRHEIYLAHAQRPYLVMNVAVRGEGDARLLAPAVRRVLHELDPAKPAHGIHDLAQLTGATYARDRYLTLSLSAFALAAVLLALVGVHGVLAHRVRERTREIGVRIALGASGGVLVRWVAAQGLRLVLAGLALGALVSALLARVLAGLLFGTSPLDPAALVAMVTLPVVALLVSLGPAWRAARTDPAAVLRAG
jgi:putative ABC transport system permease protein